MLWIETEKPNVEQIAELVNRVREQVPNAKLVYNNSPSFNWTLKFREQVYSQWQQDGRDLSAYPDPSQDPKVLMDASLDGSELAKEADHHVQNFQRDGAREAGIFHHLITLPTYHQRRSAPIFLLKGILGRLRYACLRARCATSGDSSRASLSEAPRPGVQILVIPTRNTSAAKNALKAGGEANTMNQF